MVLPRGWLESQDPPLHLSPRGVWGGMQVVTVPSRNKHSLVPARTLEGCPNHCDRTGLWGRTGEGKCLLFSVLPSALLELVQALPKNSTQLNQNSPEACAPALGLQAAPCGLGEADEPAAVVGP